MPTMILTSDLEGRLTVLIDGRPMELRHVSAALQLAKAGALIYPSAAWILLTESGRED
jgi:hypothetical protein